MPIDIELYQYYLSKYFPISQTKQEEIIKETLKIEIVKNTKNVTETKTEEQSKEEIEIKQIILSEVKSTSNEEEKNQRQLIKKRRNSYRF